MFKLIPDFGGGFLLVPDYGGMLAGDLGLMLMVSCAIALPAGLIIQDPEAFAMAFGCLCLGLFLVMLTGTCLGFLAPLAVPLFSYGLVSLCNALLASSEGALLIFMYLIVGVILLLGNAAIWAAAGGETAGAFSVILSIAMWFSCSGSTMENATGAINYYILKAEWFVAAAAMIFMIGKLLYQSAFKKDGKLLLDHTVSLLGGMAAGLFPLAAASLLAGMVRGWISALVLLIVSATLFGLCALLISKLLPDKQSAVTGITALIILSAALWFWQTGDVNVRDMVMQEAIPMITHNPVSLVLANMAGRMADFTAPLVSELIY